MSSTSKFKEWKINESIEYCIKLIIQKSPYITDDPYKTSISALRRKEYLRDLFDIFQYDESLHKDFIRVLETSLSIVILGASECVALQHLARIVSTPSLARLKSLVTLVREELGSFPPLLKSRFAEGTFIEVGSVLNCLSHKVARPRSHIYEVNVECIAKGTSLDECLNLFIRRIAEEAYRGDQSKAVVSAHLHACINSRAGTFQTIETKKMRAKRQQVLTTLKSAVMDDGDIYLEFYLFVNRALPALSNKAAHYIEPTEGFVRVIRKYRFIYCDEQRRMRCFSKHPFEVLAKGIFFDMGDAKLYREAFVDHSNRMTRQGSLVAFVANGLARSSANSGNANSRKKDSSANKNNFDGVQLSILAYLEQLGTKGLQQFNTGSLVSACETLMLLYAIVSPNTSRLPFCMIQLSVVTNGIAGYLRAAMDAVEVMQAVLSLVSKELNDLIAIEEAGDPEETAKITKIEIIYGHLSSFIFEIKQLVLGVIRDIDCSDLRSVADFLRDGMLRLFQKRNAARPMIYRELLQGQDIRSNLLAIENCSKALVQLDCTLRMLKSSVAADTLLNILELDTNDGVASFSIKRTLQTLNGNSVSQTNLNASRSSDAAAQNRVPPSASGVLDGKDNRKDSAASQSTDNSSERDYDLLPDTLVELLGYVDCMVKGLPKWVPFQPSKYLFTIVDPFKALASNLGHSLDIDMLAPKLSDNFLDICASLFFNNIPLHGGLDLVESIKLESGRYDIPKFIICEGTMLRYLVESHFVRFIHEAVFLAISSSVDQIPYTNICGHLHKCSAFYQLHNGVIDDDIHSCIFSSVRRNAVQDIEKCPGAVRVPMGTALSGGLFALDRILCGIYNPASVFKLAWQLPPLFAHPPYSSTGLRISLHAGVSVETALLWSRLSTTEIRRKVATSSAAAASKDQSGSQTQGSSTQAKDFVPQEPSPLVDTDVGLSPYMGPIEIEVLVKVVYDHLSSQDKVHQVFVDQVESCLRFLHSHPHWKLYKDLVVGDRMKQKGRGGKRFNINRAMQDESFNMLMKAQIITSESATVDAAVALPEPENRITAKALIKLLQDAALTSNANRSDGNMDLFSPDDDQLASDATRHDNDRICAESTMSGRVQKLLKSSVRCYVPCVIRFTLVAHLSENTRRVLGSTVSMPQQKDKGRYDVPCSDSDNLAISSSKGGVLLSKQDMALFAGNEEDISRLAASTVWFSPTACAAVWECVDNSLPGVIYHELAWKWNALNDRTSANNRASVVSEAYITSLLTQQYELSGRLFRCYSSLAFKLDTVIRAIELCTNLLSKDCLSTVAVDIFGQTLMRHVCLALRLLTSSPQAVHLRGGCALILRTVAELEKVLKLSTLEPLSCFVALPSTLPAPSVSATVQQPTEPNGNTTGSSGTAGAATTAKGKGLSGEAELRNTLVVSETAAAASELLHELRVMAIVLLNPLTNDLYEAVPELRTLSKDFPKMNASANIKELLLGPTPLPAIVEAFRRRAAYPHNKELDSPADSSSKAQFADMFDRSESVFDDIEEQQEEVQHQTAKSKFKLKTIARTMKMFGKHKIPGAIAEEDGVIDEEDEDDAYNSDEEYRPRNWKALKAARKLQQQSNERLGDMVDPQPSQQPNPATSADSYIDDFDPLFPDYNDMPQTLPVTGFQLAGQSVRDASRGQSMLGLLRTYHEVAGPVLPNADDVKLEAYSSMREPTGLLAFRQYSHQHNTPDSDGYLASTSGAIDEIKFFNSENGKLEIRADVNSPRPPRFPSDAYEEEDVPNY